MYILCIVLFQESFEHFSSLGLGDLPQVLVNGVPLKQEELDSENFEEALVSGISGMTPQLQKAVYNVSTVCVQ